MKGRNSQKTLSWPLIINENRKNGMKIYFFALFKYFFNLEIFCKDDVLLQKTSRSYSYPLIIFNCEKYMRRFFKFFNKKLINF
jgi:hypothetical protein